MKYSYCSIWGVGPGRPFDNCYILTEIEVNNSQIRLCFESECCIILNPQGVCISDDVMKIEDASKIIWRYYYYGLPKVNDNIVIEEYYKNKEKIEKSIKGKISGVFQSTIQGQAFELHGNINEIINKPKN